jgi:hypothetical protein
VVNRFVNNIIICKVFCAIIALSHVNGDPIDPRPGSGRAGNGFLIHQSSSTDSIMAPKPSIDQSKAVAGPIKAMRSFSGCIQCKYSPV